MAGKKLITTNELLIVMGLVAAMWAAVAFFSGGGSTTVVRSEENAAMLACRQWIQARIGPHDWHASTQVKEGSDGGFVIVGKLTSDATGREHRFSCRTDPGGTLTNAGIR